MKEKTRRQEAILNIIGRQRICSQEDLMTALAAEGFAATQATLSRDLREMKVSKQPDGDGYACYRPSGAALRIRPNHLESGVGHIEFAEGLGVIRVAPGYAPMIASRIDGMNAVSLMGTLAGDDTLLLILRPGATRESVLRELESILPGISAREKRHA